MTVKSTWTTITVVRLNAKLTTDIDLGGESWTPIGEYNNGEEPDEVRFGGYFDGQGHVIKGLTERPADRRAAVVRAVRLCRLGCGEEPRHSRRHGHFQSR